MEDKLSIRVNVADRYYPLKIDRNDEEKIRKAAKMINEKVLQYKQRYTDKDLQDFLAMAALQFVIKLIESETKFDVSPVLDELTELDEWLGEYLEKSNISSFK
jgi:cell division protein ZapA (FtsZ GTPase activity inhibitor)